MKCDETTSAPAWDPPDEIAAIVRVYGDHVDGAPITYGVHRLNRERIRRLLALIDEFEEAVRAGRVKVSYSRAVDSSELDLVPFFIPKRATQRNPYYSIFKESRMRFDKVQLFHPELIAHIMRVSYVHPEIRLARDALSFSAQQYPITREMFTDGLDLEALYTALTLLTPESELPELMQELAVRAPQIFCRLVVRDPLVWFTPEGRKELLLPAYFRLDSAAVTTILTTGDESARQALLTNLSRILEDPSVVTRSTSPVHEPKRRPAR